MAIITISRQAGSLGEEIASQVAQKLDYNLVGGAQYHQMAMSCDLDFKNACEHFETELPLGFVERLFFQEAANKSLFEALNLELAADDNVVLMGRGAQIALAAFPSVVRVRIIAPSDLRAQRVREKLKLSEAETMVYLEHHDRRRRALIESIFQVDLGDMTLYDLVINTKEISGELATELICLTAQAMEQTEDKAVLRATLKARAFAKRVESAIKKRIITSPTRDLVVSSQDGKTVALEGFVASRDNRETAGRIAADYPGVAGVDNQLRFTELSF